jgi:hypothetical protein
MKNEDQAKKLPIGKRKRTSNNSSDPLSSGLMFFAVKHDLPPETEEQKQNYTKSKSDKLSSIDQKLDELKLASEKNSNIAFSNKNNQSTNNINNETNKYNNTVDNNSVNVRNEGSKTIKNDSVNLKTENIRNFESNPNNQLYSYNYYNSDSVKTTNPTFITKNVNPYLIETKEKLYPVNSYKNEFLYDTKNITKQNKNESSSNFYENSTRFNQSTNNRSQSNLSNNITNQSAASEILNKISNKNTETFDINKNSNTQFNSPNTEMYNIKSTSQYNDINKSLYDTENNSNEFKSPSQYINTNKNVYDVKNSSNEIKSPTRYVKNDMNFIKFDGINQEIPSFADGGDAVVSGQSLIEVGTDKNNYPKTEKIKIQSDPEMDKIREMIQLTLTTEKQSKSSTKSDIVTVPVGDTSVVSAPPSANNITIKSMSTLDEVLMLSTFVPSWRSGIG